jgi:hypothetical protein
VEEEDNGRVVVMTPSRGRGKDIGGFSERLFNRSVLYLFDNEFKTISVGKGTAQGR